MDYKPPSSSSTSKSGSSSSDSETESDEESQCSTIELSAGEEIDILGLSAYSDTNMPAQYIDDFQSFQKLEDLLIQNGDVEEENEDEDDHGDGQARVYGSGDGHYYGYNDDICYADYGYGDDDHNNEDYEYGTGDNINGDGDGHPGHLSTWADSYFDISDGSGNYSYGRAYLDQLLEALTNHLDTVHVVDGSYVQTVNYQFRSSAFPFRFYSNGNLFAELYVDLPPSAAPPASCIIDPRPRHGHDRHGAGDGNNSITVCPICRRNLSFDDNGNMEEGGATEGSGKQETHPPENQGSEKLQDQEMKQSTMEQQKQNSSDLDGISEQKKQDTSDPEKRHTSGHDGKHEQQKQEANEKEEGNTSAQEKQNPYDGHDSFKDK